MSAPPDITLRIDELVLDGFPAVDRRALAAALQRELVRLLRELAPGAPFSGAREQRGGRLDLGGFVAPANGSADALGVEIARALHRGLAGAPPAARSPA